MSGDPASKPRGRGVREARAPGSGDRSAGHYARKQIHCPSRLVSWSHGSRFDLARRLVAAGAGGRLLDYGCGDGTFVAMVHDQFHETRGVDVEPAQVADCQTRLGDLPGVTFGLTRDLAATDAGVWTAVTCMEVLEHCLEPERQRILDELARLCAPDGRVVISVPIETGPSLLGKQLVRALAGLRGLGDYEHRERYTPIELLRSAFGLPVPRVSYQGHGVEQPFTYYGHKGFEWHDVEREIAARMTIVERLFSPMPWAGPILNSQAWFVCSTGR